MSFLNVINRGDADRLAREIPFNRLIFARQMIVVSDFLENLDPQDRISPFLRNINALQKTLILSSGRAIVETSR